MGLYYTLSNGEEIEIDIQEDENYNKKILIKLFNGSTTIEYDYFKKPYSLNEIIAEVEKDYDRLLERDRDFTYRAWCD